MSDTLRRRLAALLLVIGIAVAVLAIKDVGPFSDPPTQEEKVPAWSRTSSTRPPRAIRRRSASCSPRTRATTLEVEHGAAAGVRRAARRAPQILDVLAPAFEDSKIDVRFVSISGTRARVEARYKLADSPAQPRTILLELQEGEWHVSDPG